jgi:hypothetical protein
VLRTNPELSDWSGMTALLRASWTEHKKSARPDLSVFGSVDTLPPRGAREVLAPKDASPSNLAGAILTGLLLVAAYAQLRAGPKATSWLQYPSPTQILLHDMKHVAMWTRYGRFTKSATLCDPPAAPVKRTGFKRPHASGNAAGPVPAATAIHGVIEAGKGDPPRSGLGMLEAMRDKGGVTYSRFDALFYLLKHEAATRSVKRRGPPQPQAQAQTPMYSQLVR